MKITIMAVKTAGNAKKGIAASGVALVNVKTGETVANAYVRSGGAEGDESKSIAALDVVNQAILMSSRGHTTTARLGAIIDAVKASTEYGRWIDVGSRLSLIKPAVDTSKTAIAIAADNKDNLQRVARINKHLSKSTISTYVRTRLLSIKIKTCDAIFGGEPIDSNAIMSTDWVEVASEAAVAAVAYNIRRLKRELTAARKVANEVAMREIAKQGYKA